MNEEFKLSDIKIGFTDGAREAEESNFLDIFYNENKKYEQIMDKNKFIISGRKGTGKTILAKYVQKNNKKKTMLVEYTKLNDISLHEYIDAEGANTPKDDRKLFQIFYVYKQLLLTIKDQRLSFFDFVSRKYKPWDNIKGIYNYFMYKKEYKKIINFYEKCYPKSVYHETEIRTMQKIIQATESQVSANMGEAGGLQGLASETTELSKEVIQERRKFYELMEQYKEYVLSALKYIDVILIIDDLDELKMTSYEHTLEFLISFVTKVNEINLEIQKVNKKSKCILLLRSDILSKFNTRSSNINKILSDCNVELQWFKDESGDELAKMIMHKIKNSVKNNHFQYCDLATIRKTLFKKGKGKSDTFDRIVKYTFGRPRDVITYLDCIISQHKDLYKINYPMLTESESTYSKRILFEMKNEMHFNLSDQTIAEIENLLRQFGKRNFTYDGIVEYYSSHVNEYPNITSIDDTLQYLYELGIIGNYRVHNGEQLFSWAYRNGGDTLNKDEQITIHLALRKALNL